MKPREEQIIKMRFGLVDGSEQTLEEIGQHFKLTRERIRQIEAKALRKLRHPARSNRLLALWCAGHTGRMMPKTTRRSTMIPSKSRNVPPKASAMIEALRGLGYTAGERARRPYRQQHLRARHRRCDLVLLGRAASRITVLDNGDGMDDGELERAMRLGERSPLD